MAFFFVVFIIRFIMKLRFPQSESIVLDLFIMYAIYYSYWFEVSNTGLLLSKVEKEKQTHSWDDKYGICIL